MGSQAKYAVIGITDSRKQWFPPEVMEVIKSGKVFSGGKRHHEIMKDFLPKNAVWIDITVPLRAILCSSALPTLSKGNVRDAR